MKNAPDRKAAESAQTQRDFTTAAANRRTELEQAVADIGAAVATLARLAECHAARKGGGRNDGPQKASPGSAATLRGSGKLSRSAQRFYQASPARISLRRHRIYAAGRRSAQLYGLDECPAREHQTDQPRQRSDHQVWLGVDQQDSGDAHPQQRQAPARHVLSCEQ